MESAFYAEIRGGPQFRGWDEDRYMTARLIDSIRALTFLFICANTDPKKSKPKPPVPHPIPEGFKSIKPPDKPGSFAYIAKAHLARAKRRKEGGG